MLARPPATVVRRLEKAEQSEIVALLNPIGARVYVLGTRRRRGAPCPHCGTFVSEDQRTRQTPGFCDLLAFLPWRLTGGVPARRLLMIEVKSARGARRPEQREFRDLCAAAGVDHLVGTAATVRDWLEHEDYIRSRSHA